MNVLAYGFPPGTPAGMGKVNEQVLSRLSMYHEVALVSPTNAGGEMNGVGVALVAGVIS